MRRRDTSAIAPGRTKTAYGISTGCMAACLAGYPLGIWLGRAGTDEAARYWTGYLLAADTYTGWGHVMVQVLPGAFLQLLAVYGCGYCAMGMGLLPLLFALRSGGLGYCAAAVYLEKGAKALLTYRLLMGAAELGTLVLCLWLAQYAGRLSIGLYQSVFCGGAPRGRLQADARSLTLRFGAACLLSIMICGIGAFTAVFIAGILL